MASTIQVRVDEKLKTNADNLFRDLGTDTTTAIRIFLTQAVQNNGFPFEIKRTATSQFPIMNEEEFLAKLETSRKHAEDCEVIAADEAITGMRSKYGI